MKKLEKEFPYHKPMKIPYEKLGKYSLGRICEIQKNTYKIRFWEKEISGRLQGAFYNKNWQQPVVGDYVTFEFNPRGDSRILEVCPRKSEIKRPDQSGHAIGYVKTMVEQVMVANCDYVFIFTSLNDDYSLSRIARYVATIIAGRAVPVVILTKADLCNDVSKYVNEVQNLSKEVKVHAISTIQETGMDALKCYMKSGITIALLGSSGVGKSTFINAIVGKEIMKINTIRERDSKGRHTTTYRQLIELENGVTLIDTPGMREFGMCDVKEGIDETFSDIIELTKKCRFSNCKHQTEPGCAIKDALESGALSNTRYDLYQRLSGENRYSTSIKLKDRKYMKNAKIYNVY